MRRIAVGVRIKCPASTLRSGHVVSGSLTYVRIKTLCTACISINRVLCSDCVILIYDTVVLCVYCSEPSGKHDKNRTRRAKNCSKKCIRSLKRSLLYFL